MSRKRISDKAGWVNHRRLPTGPNGRAMCRRCGIEVPRGRKTFCSAICVHQHKLRSQPTYVRDCVDKRDRGVCAVCGLDTLKEIERLWGKRPVGSYIKPVSEPRNMRDRARLEQTCGNHFRKGAEKQPWGRWAEEFKSILGVYPWARRHLRFWDADHIKPVAEDGGTCGLANYQTLCIPCHRIKTTEQAKRRAAAKRGDTQQPKQENIVSAEKPTAKAMQKSLKQFMTNDDNNPHRLVSAAKLKELAKALDPDIRMDKQVHLAVCREVSIIVKKAMLRCYDNKRSTIRPADL